jgi:hypothetical protein
MLYGSPYFITENGKGKKEKFIRVIGAHLDPQEMPYAHAPPSKFLYFLCPPIRIKCGNKHEVSSI